MGNHNLYKFLNDTHMGDKNEKAQPHHHTKYGMN